MSAFTRDWFERVAWTVVQVVAGVLVTEVAGIDVWWAGVVAAGLAAVKGFAARKIGDPDSAATLL